MVEISTSPYTASENGYILVLGKSNTTWDTVGYVYGAVNSVPFSVFGSRSVNGINWLPIKKGQVLTFTKYVEGSYVRFYPLIK